ncbi:hypothetical protein [Candidatus Tisiphia endosymbiont of Hybos culiciformis]|uniref:hypothetical protein n=1 Tax=Candidatus Tisiphia endosymbiont of Hybos culiciformis TaxID=3139331 RepID=UPI003CCB348A
MSKDSITEELLENQLFEVLKTNDIDKDRKILEVCENIATATINLPQDPPPAKLDLYKTIYKYQLNKLDLDIKDLKKLSAVINDSFPGNEHKELRNVIDTHLNTSPMEEKISLTTLYEAAGNWTKEQKITLNNSAKQYLKQYLNNPQKDGEQQLDKACFELGLYGKNTEPFKSFIKNLLNLNKETINSIEKLKTSLVEKNIQSINEVGDELRFDERFISYKMELERYTNIKDAKVDARIRNFFRNEQIKIEEKAISPQDIDKDRAQKNYDLYSKKLLEYSKYSKERSDFAVIVNKLLDDGNVEAFISQQNLINCLEHYDLITQYENLSTQQGQYTLSGINVAWENNSKLNHGDTGFLVSKPDIVNPYLESLPSQTIKLGADDLETIRVKLNYAKNQRGDKPFAIVCSDGIHWTLLVVEPIEQKYRFIDSYGESLKDQNLKKILEDDNNLKNVDVPPIKQQSNNLSCGAWVLQNAQTIMTKGIGAKLEEFGDKELLPLHKDNLYIFDSEIRKQPDFINHNINFLPVRDILPLEKIAEVPKVALNKKILESADVPVPNVLKMPPELSAVINDSFPGNEHKELRNVIDTHLNTSPMEEKISLTTLYEAAGNWTKEQKITLNNSAKQYLKQYLNNPQKDGEQQLDKACFELGLYGKNTEPFKSFIKNLLNLNKEIINTKVPDSIDMPVQNVLKTPLELSAVINDSFPSNEHKELRNIIDTHLAEENRMRQAELAGKRKAFNEDPKFKLVKDMLRDKGMAEQQAFVAKGAKQAGLSAGYIAQENVTGNSFILKQFYKSHTDCLAIDNQKKRMQALNDRRDGVQELIGSSLYQLLLYDRAPKEELVTPDQNNPNSLFVRSKFFDNVVQLYEFAGSPPGEPLKADDNKELQKLEGLEKVIAACHMLGEIDYYAANLMVQDGNTVTKIDHGRSFMEFHQDFPAMIKSTYTRFVDFGYAGAIRKGNLSFSIEKYSESLKQMLTQLDEKKIDDIVEQRIAELRKAGFNPEGITTFAKFQDGNAKPTAINNFADLKLFYKKNIKENLTNMKEVAKSAEIVSKFSNVSHPFKKGQWIEAFAQSRTQDPVSYAAHRDIKIEGKNALQWAHDNNYQIKVPAAPITEIVQEQQWQKNTTDGNGKNQKFRLLKLIKLQQV